MRVKLGAELWNTYSSILDSPWRTTRPDRGGSTPGLNFRRGFTLSRISTRFFASAGLSGGVPPDDCSTSNVVETMKGMGCESTPSFAKSSGVIGGKSDEGHRPSVSHAMTVGIDTHRGSPGYRETL